MWLQGRKILYAGIFQQNTGMTPTAYREKKWMYFNCLSALLAYAIQQATYFYKYVQKHQKVKNIAFSCWLFSESGI